MLRMSGYIAPILVVPSWQAQGKFYLHLYLGLSNKESIIMKIWFQEILFL
jgi:hypothetical protein